MDRFSIVEVFLGFINDVQQGSFRGRQFALFGGVGAQVGIMDDSNSLAIRPRSVSASRWQANGRKTKRGTEAEGGVRSRVIGFHWSAWCRTRAGLQPKLPSNERSTDLCTPYSRETCGKRFVYLVGLVGINQWRVRPMWFIFFLNFTHRFDRLLLYTINFIKTFLFMYNLEITSFSKNHKQRKYSFSSILILRNHSFLDLLPQYSLSFVASYIDSYQIRSQQFPKINLNFLIIIHSERYCKWPAFQRVAQQD